MSGQFWYLDGVKIVEFVDSVLRSGNPYIEEFNWLIILSYKSGMILGKIKIFLKIYHMS